METSRGDAATWIICGNESRRRHGRDVNVLWRRVAGRHRYGSEFSIVGPDNRRFGISLSLDDDVNAQDSDSVMFQLDYPRYNIPSLTQRWAWGEEAVVGLLVDMSRGCAAFRLNGFDGPCVFFPLPALWKVHGVAVWVGN